ncbi:MAG: sigma 54-interacting transcriptional regulator [Myxococcota bacterium]
MMLGVVSSSTEGPLANSSDTLSALDEHASGGSSSPVASLVFVVCGDDWTRPSQRIPLPPRKELVVGRGDGSGFSLGEDLRVPDRTLSRRHGRLSPSGRGTVIEDLGSKNGTRVNGVPIEGSIHLADGDVVEFGHSFFVYRRALLTEAQGLEPYSLSSSILSTLSLPFENVLRDLEKLAPSKMSLLISGESGVGKELVARGSHELSGRRGRFVAVNCGALPEALVEAELFGARKGAFTGAEVERSGLVRAADQGTLFLDEIGELPLPAQAKFLRVLQERKVMPVGGTEARPVDFRLVSATHQDLRARVAQGAFRGDLYARIVGHRVVVPPLRSRREDLGLLLRHFLSLADEPPSSLSRALVRKLILHPWPYNVRELENALSVGSSLVAGDAMSARDVQLEAALEARARSSESPSDDEIRTRLVELLVRHDGNISQVARSMGKARMQIHRWMKRFGIDPSSPRGPAL